MAAAHGWSLLSTQHHQLQQHSCFMSRVIVVSRPKRQTMCIWMLLSAATMPPDIKNMLDAAAQKVQTTDVAGPEQVQQELDGPQPDNSSSLTGAKKRKASEAAINDRAAKAAAADQARQAKAVEKAARDEAKAALREEKETAKAAKAAARAAEKDAKLKLKEAREATKAAKQAQATLEKQRREDKAQEKREQREAVRKVREAADGHKPVGRPKGSSASSYHGYDRDADAAAAEELLATMDQTPAQGTRRKSNAASATGCEEKLYDDEDACEGVDADQFVCANLVKEYRASEKKFQARQAVDGDGFWDEDTTVEMLFMRHELATKVTGSRDRKKGGTFWTSAMVDKATATNLTAAHLADSQFQVTDAQVCS